MSAIDEARARLERTKAEGIREPCPRCGRDECGCYTSGEFWDMQRQLRAADLEAKRCCEALSTACARAETAERERDEARAEVELLTKERDSAEADCSALRAELERVREAPIPMLLWCPKCNARHIDEGEFATKPHRDHACQSCGLTWRPAKVPTVGVAFLPGYRDATAAKEGGGRDG